MTKIKDWLVLSRIPFLSVSVAPYILGTLIAARLEGRFNPAVFLLGLGGVLLVQLATHYSGEVYDIKEDRLSVTLEKNFFSGGSQVLVENLIAPKRVKIVTGVVIGLALLIGIILQFYFKTGSWTLALGSSGIICGFFYSKPPLRWVSRGCGEIFVAYAFGWLAVSAGYYLQTAHFNLLASMISLPIACAVTNILLVNEYPDYPADIQSGKLNLLVRLGKEKGAFIYAALTIFSVLTFFLALAKGFPLKSAIFYFPVLILALSLAVRMLRGEYKDKGKLEQICGMTILVSLGTNLSAILGLLLKR